MKKQIFGIFIFLSIFCVDTNISCSEKPQKKQSNIVLRMIKPLAIAIPIIMTGRDYVHNATKECGMDKYPHAKAWYNKMDEKYPVADLNDAEFCEDSNWLSSSNRIYFPSVELTAINSIYNKKMSNQTINEIDNRILNINEFLLLHEAGHRKNDDMGLVNIGYKIAKQQMARAAMLNVNTIPFVGEVMAYVYNSDEIVKFHLDIEKRADKFACDHAQDVDILQGGLIFFNHLTINNLNDPLHPNSYERALKVVDEMKRRRITENTCPAQK